MKIHSPVRTLLAAAILPALVQAAPVPPTDNTSAPYMGIYVGSPYGSSHAGRVSFAASWMNRSDLWAEEFMNYNSWTEIQGPNWLLDSGKNWLNGNPTQRKYILSVPMLPGYIGSDGYGVPLAGTSLALGASGSHNSNFQLLAQRLASRLLSNGAPMASRTIIRLGWEFNGRWYPWRVLSQAEANSFAEYFRQIVTTMRSVPGTAGLEFCWNGVPGWTAYPLGTAYPGNDYVDTIGVDVYDQSWAADTYPYPASADTPAEILSIRTSVWTNGYGASWNNGLAWYNSFAKTQGKALSIPEWGVMNRTDGHGGLDNDYFVQKMYNFIQEPANNVQWHVYFDYNNTTAASRLVPHPGHTVQFPVASAKLQTLFSVPSLLSDDFTDGNATGWTASPAARWSVAADAGNNAYKFDFDWNNQSGLSTAGTATWSNYSFTTEFKITDFQSYSRTHLFFRYVSSTNHYCLQVRENGGSRRLVLVRVVNGASTDLQTFYTPINVNTWYEIGITANGSSISATFNGAPAIQVTDSAHAAGMIGLGAWKQDVLFDNITVAP